MLVFSEMISFSRFNFSLNLFHIEEPKISQQKKLKYFNFYIELAIVLVFASFIDKKSVITFTDKSGGV